MSEIALVMLASIRQHLRLKIAAIVFICTVVICVAGVAITFCLLAIAPEMRAEYPDRYRLEQYLGLIVYVTCLIGLGVNLNAFAFQSMTREKTRGNIQSLLATPLEIRNIWIGKSLGVFLPGLVVGEVLAVIALVSINYIYFVPRLGFLLTPLMAVNIFVAPPLIYLCLSLLAYLIGLTGKPASANLIVQISLPVVVTLMINLVMRNVLHIAGWPFVLFNLGIAAAVTVIFLVLQPRLTRERIVLSQ
jgi:ABC-2 type transport system permease protein